MNPTTNIDRMRVAGGTSPTAINGDHAIGAVVNGRDSFVLVSGTDIKWSGTYWEIRSGSTARWRSQAPHGALPSDVLVWVAQGGSTGTITVTALSRGPDSLVSDAPADPDGPPGELITADESNLTAAHWSDELVSNPTAGNTFTVDGVVYTFRASAALAREITIGATVGLTRNNMITEINGLGIGTAHPSVEAFATSGSRLGLLALAPGTAGNSITVATSNATPWGGSIPATLSGGGRPEDAPGQLIPGAVEPATANWSGQLVSNPSDGDTYALGDIVYTWRNSPVADTDVEIGEEPHETAGNLIVHILGAGPWDSHPLVTGELSYPGILLLDARKPGTRGNDITVVVSNATPWGGSVAPNFAGGAGPSALEELISSESPGAPVAPGSIV